MTKEKRERKRNALRRLQRERAEWKRDHPQEAKLKAIADAVDREKRAIVRAERLANRADRIERRKAAYLKRRADVEKAKETAAASGMKALRRDIAANRRATPASPKPRRRSFFGLFSRAKVGA